MYVYDKYIDIAFDKKVILLPFKRDAKDMFTYHDEVRGIFWAIVMATAFYPKREQKHLYLGFVATYINKFTMYQTPKGIFDDRPEDIKDFCIANLARVPALLYGSTDHYYNALQKWTPFSSNNGENIKNTLRGLTVQGMLCGTIFDAMLDTGISLKEAINSTIQMFREDDKYKHIQDQFPTLNYNNIANNYWPGYKSVAWLWSALRKITPPVFDDQYIDTWSHDEFEDWVTGRSYKSPYGWKKIMNYADISHKCYMDQIDEGTHTISNNNIWRFYQVGNPKENEIFPMDNLYRMNEIFTEVKSRGV